MVAAGPSRAADPPAAYEGSIQIGDDQTRPTSRHLVDYLQEIEGFERLGWPDQERGVRQHIAVLLPYLTASARRAFEAALARVSGHDHHRVA